MMSNDSFRAGVQNLADTICARYDSLINDFKKTFELHCDCSDRVRCIKCTELKKLEQQMKEMEAKYLVP